MGATYKVWAQVEKMGKELEDLMVAVLEPSEVEGQALDSPAGVLVARQGWW